jgi:uncharacterized protein YlxW (UPF0749 family)
LNSSGIIALAIVMVVIGIAGTAYMKGRSDGSAAEQLKHAEDMRRLNSSLAEKERELSALELTRLNEVTQLEQEVDQLKDQADEDATATRPAISLDGVRRLNRVR